jgi:hypothetical protein
LQILSSDCGQGFGVRHYSFERFHSSVVRPFPYRAMARASKSILIPPPLPRCSGNPRFSLPHLMFCDRISAFILSQSCGCSKLRLTGGV